MKKKNFIAKTKLYLKTYTNNFSLSICEKQVAPVLRRKAEEIEDNKPSKHQIKKEKRAERKKNKKQKQNKNNSRVYY